jgi:hypothetical protein
LIPHVPDFALANAERKLSFVTRQIGEFLRLTRQPDTEPYWGKSQRYRFDDPLARFGVTYAAEQLEVAFAETILHEVADFDGGAWIVPHHDIDRRWIVSYTPPARELQLLDLTGVHLKRLGLNNDVCSGSDYAFTQALSRAVHDQVPEADGIYYLSRQLNTQFAAAFFERSALKCGAANTKLDTHSRYPALLNMFGVEILGARLR